MPLKMTVAPFDPALGARKRVAFCVPFLFDPENTYTEDIEAWLAGRSFTELATANQVPLSVLAQYILLRVHPELADVWPQTRWSPAQRRSNIAKRVDVVVRRYK